MPSTRAMPDEERRYNALLHVLRVTGACPSECFASLPPPTSAQTVWVNDATQWQDTLVAMQLLYPGSALLHPSSRAALHITVAPAHRSSQFPSLCVVSLGTQWATATATRSGRQEVVVKEWDLTRGHDSVTGAVQLSIPLRTIYTVVSLLAPRPVDATTPLLLSLRFLGHVDGNGSHVHAIRHMRIEYDARPAAPPTVARGESAAAEYESEVEAAVARPPRRASVEPPVVMDRTTGTPKRAAPPSPPAAGSAESSLVEVSPLSPPGPRVRTHSPVRDVDAGPGEDVHARRLEASFLDSEEDDAMHAVHRYGGAHPGGESVHEEPEVRPSLSSSFCVSSRRAVRSPSVTSILDGTSNDGRAAAAPRFRTPTPVAVTSQEPSIAPVTLHAERDVLWRVQQALAATTTTTHHGHVDGDAAHRDTAPLLSQPRHRTYENTALSSSSFASRRGDLASRTPSHVSAESEESRVWVWPTKSSAQENRTDPSTVSTRVDPHKAASAQEPHETRVWPLSYGRPRADGREALKAAPFTFTRPKAASRRPSQLSSSSLSSSFVQWVNTSVDEDIADEKCDTNAEAQQTRDGHRRRHRISVTPTFASLSQPPATAIDATKATTTTSVTADQKTKKHVLSDIVAKPSTTPSEGITTSSPSPRSSISAVPSLSLIPTPPARTQDENITIAAAAASPLPTDNHHSETESVMDGSPDAASPPPPLITPPRHGLTLMNPNIPADYWLPPKPLAQPPSTHRARQKGTVPQPPPPLLLPEAVDQLWCLPPVVTFPARKHHATRDGVGARLLTITRTQSGFDAQGRPSYMTDITLTKSGVRGKGLMPALSQWSARLRHKARGAATTLRDDVGSDALSTQSRDETIISPSDVSEHTSSTAQISPAKNTSLTVYSDDLVHVLTGDVAYRSGYFHLHRVQSPDGCLVLLCNQRLVTAVELDSAEEVALAKSLLTATSVPSSV